MKIVLVCVVLIWTMQLVKTQIRDRNLKSNLMYALDDEMPLGYLESLEYYKIHYNPVNAAYIPEVIAVPTVDPIVNLTNFMLGITTTTTPVPPIVYEFSKNEIFEIIYSSRTLLYAANMWNYITRSHRIVKYYDMPAINVTKLPTYYYRPVPWYNRTSLQLLELQVHPEHYLFLSIEEIEDSLDAYAEIPDYIIDPIDPIIRILEFPEDRKKVWKYKKMKRNSTQHAPNRSMYHRLNISQIKQLIQSWVMNIIAAPAIETPSEIITTTTKTIGTTNRKTPERRPYPFKSNLELQLYLTQFQNVQPYFNYTQN